MRASLYTLGCRLNQAETAIIAKSLKTAGFDIVEFGHPSDLTVINTCTVTEQADAKCRQAVRKTLRKYPESFVAVVGCYAQMAVDSIKTIRGIDLIIGNEYKLKLADYLDGLEKKETPLIIHSPKLSRTEFTIESYGLYDNTTRANLKIQDGCNFVCSFCIIPTARGSARSRKMSDILDEANTLVDLGHQELVITGVNLGTFKNAEMSIIDVLKKLENISGLRRIRISSIEPTTIPDELIHLMADSEKICKHLHVPLQSGDDTILKSMRRKYKAKEFAEFIDFVYKTVPDVGIGTDVMVGFPGEGDQEFVNTKKLLADLPVSYYHVFTYSDRTGTGSYHMAEKVPQTVKKQRARIMIEQGKRKKYTFYETYLGKKQSVLFEQQNENDHWAGYTSNYMNVETVNNSNLHNKLCEVSFNSLETHALIGNIVD